jgi:hypothetical protein
MNAQLLFCCIVFYNTCVGREGMIRKVIGSWKKHNGGRYIRDVPQAIPHTGHHNKEHIA